MELYNTRQEAIEAHPDCDAVVTTGPEWEHSKEHLGRFRPVWFNDSLPSGYSYKKDDDSIGPCIGSVDWVIAEPPKEDELNEVPGYCDKLNEIKSKLDDAFNSAYPSIERAKEDEFKNGDVVYDIVGNKAKVLLCRGKEVVIDHGSSMQVQFASNLTKVPPLKEGWYLCEKLSSGAEQKVLFWNGLILSAVKHDTGDNDFSSFYHMIAPMTIGEEL